MARDIKNLFNNASKNTASFYTFTHPDTDETFDGTEGVFKTEESGGGIIDAIKKAAGKFSSGYGNRLDAYNAYLNTLKRLDVGIKRLPGRVDAQQAFKKPGVPSTAIRGTSFEDKLSEWESRMRRFSFARYYAELGKK